VLLPGLDFQGAGEPEQAVNLQRFSAAANVESLSPGPGDAGLALLRVRALYNVTSRSSGWCRHRGSGKGHAHLQTAL